MLYRSLFCLCLAPLALFGELLTPEELTQELIDEVIYGQRDELCVRFEAGTELPLSFSSGGVVDALASGSVQTRETLDVRFTRTGLQFAVSDGEWLAWNELFTGNLGCALLAGEEPGVHVALNLELR